MQDVLGDGVKVVPAGNRPPRSLSVRVVTAGIRAVPAEKRQKHREDEKRRGHPLDRLDRYRESDHFDRPGRGGGLGRLVGVGGLGRRAVGRWRWRRRWRGRWVQRQVRIIGWGLSR